jgi:hypothetical protein
MKEVIANGFGRYFSDLRGRETAFRRSSGLADR